jgi:hypothetical protein
MHDSPQFGGVMIVTMSHRPAIHEEAVRVPPIDRSKQSEPGYQESVPRPFYFHHNTEATALELHRRKRPLRR